MMERQHTASRRAHRLSPTPGLIVGLCVLFFSATGKADDWGTYRFDIARTGVSPETVGPELSPEWTYVPTHRPAPAWPMPSEEMPRMHVDNALRVAVAGGSVYFGCPVTGEVHAVDAASGEPRWNFATQGPVRFAPTCCNRRVYFGSDDGYVYCLDADDGSLVWKYRPGPSDEKVIGNGRLISLWPVRTSVLVDGGVAYATAGVFPYEGVYVCALRAADGTVIWKNDTVSDRVYELEFGGISPHGYLLASKDRLYVPSGRAMPAAFDRRTGKFLFYASPGGHQGGVWAVLDGERLVAGTVFSESQGMGEFPTKVAYDAETGRPQPDAFVFFPAIELVPTPDVLYVLTQQGIDAVNRGDYARVLREGAPTIKEGKGLERRLFTLRLKVADSIEPDKEIQSQIEELTGRLNVLKAKEDALRNSCLRWHYAADGLVSLVKAGDVFYAGGRGVVVGVDARAGKEVWRHAVAGTAVGLAASGGRLLASSDQGPVYCFGPDKVSAPAVFNHQVVANPYPEDESAELYRRAARTILHESGVTRGYCLVLDCNTGRLAFELAQGSELKIVGLESDPRKIETARQRLGRAGLLGSRVVVEPWSIADLPPYFANLVVSDEAILSGARPSREEVIHVLRPCGGIWMTCNALRPDDRNDRAWTKHVRPKLQDAASWRQLYANPQNTACCEDAAVKGPLGVLWFGEPGPQQVVDRHARTDSPVSINGRLFVPGEDLIRAYDAYNGTFLWETSLPGAVRARVDVDGGNLSLTDDSLYVAAGDLCYRLDNATGKVLHKFHMPPAADGSARRWGYVCCTGGVLLGTQALPLRAGYAAGYASDGAAIPLAVRRGLQRSGAFWRTMAEFPRWGSQQSPSGALTSRMMAGDGVFALDADTGESLWRHPAKGVANITVSVAKDAVFFAECEPTEAQRAAAMEETRRLVQKGVYEQGAEAQLEPDQRDVRLVVALDLAAGKVRWQRPLDLTGCGGTKMGSAYADGLLLFFGHFSNHDQRYFLANKLTWRRITAVDARTGQVVWSRPLNYLRRPVIVGDRIIIEPRACELRTGKIIRRPHPVTGEPVAWEFLRPGHSCGVTSACAHALFYRSYCIALCEMDRDQGISLFGGIRTGCWLDIIAAGGLVLMPERSSGCTCSYPLRCSVALVHKPRKPMGNWSVFVSPGAMTPVKHLALNLGAPGDARDQDGVLWLGYPRIGKTYSVYDAYPNYGIRFDMHEKLAPGGGFFSTDFRAPGAGKSWLFESGCRGMLRCELPLIDETAGQQASTYTVRLGFLAPAGNAAARYAFDVKLQNRLVKSNDDVTGTARNPGRVIVREFTSVRVKDNLVIELVPKADTLDADRALAVSFIEVIREALEAAGEK